MWLPNVSVKHIWAPPCLVMWQNGNLRLPLNNEPPSTKTVYPWRFPRTQVNCEQEVLDLYYLHSLWLSESWYRCHASSIQVSKKCVFLEQIYTFSVPNFQEVLSHHLIYFLLISFLFFVVFFSFASSLDFFFPFFSPPFSSTSFLSLLFFY